MRHRLFTFNSDYNKYTNIILNNQVVYFDEETIMFDYITYLRITKFDIDSLDIDFDYLSIKFDSII